jgi:hypothetical protein
MNDQNYIGSVEQLVAVTEPLIVKHSHINILFRGQSVDAPLLPKLVRKNPNQDTTVVEVRMIREFRRRLARERDIAAMEDWDLLIYAQHHGLSTRLLDWTTNPLFALWFACSDYESPSDGYLYLLTARDEALLDPANNSRIRAQSGWFTAHRFSQEARQFVDLHKNTSIDGDVLMKCVRQDKKLEILKVLDKLGVNEESVYPSPEGTARHINWLYRDEL